MHRSWFLQLLYEDISRRKNVFEVMRISKLGPLSKTGSSKALLDDLTAEVKDEIGSEPLQAS